MKFSRFLPIIVGSVIALLLFRKIFFGLIPFPGDFLVAWYEPWKSMTSAGGTLGIAHKPVLDDVFRQLYPYKMLTKQIILSGSLPFWNPYNGNGMPFLATMHAGFLTPLILLFLLFSGPMAWTIYIVIQPIIFSMGFWWYMRKLGCSRVASLLAILIFLLSGFAVVRYEFGEYLYVASCLPYLLAIVEEYKEHASTRLKYLIPVITCFMFISGQPQMILYVLAFFMLYSLHVCRSARISILPILLFTAAGIFLSSFQLLPTIELYRLSNMTHAASEFIFTRFLFPWYYFISFFIPNFFGSPGTYNYWAKIDYVETALYVGMAPVLLLVTAVTGKSADKNAERIKILFIGTIGITVLMTLSWPVSRLLYSLPLPILGTGIPTRIFFLTIFSASVLSGIGFDICRQNSKSFWKSFWICLGIILAVILFTLFSGSTHVQCDKDVIYHCMFTSLRMTTVRNIFLESAVFLLFVIGIWMYRKFGRIGLFISCIVLCLSGLYNANKFLPFSPVRFILPDVPLITKIKEFQNTRVIGIGSAEISPDIASYFRFYDPQYYDPLYLKRYGELFSYAKSGDSQKGLSRSDIYLSGWDKSDPEAQGRIEKLLDLASAGVLLYKKDEYMKERLGEGALLWEDGIWVLADNNDAVARFSIVPNFEKISGSTETLRRLFEETFDPNTTVLLDNTYAPNSPLKQEDLEFLSRVEIVEQKENSFTVNTRSSHDGFFVVTDNYYPGWTAWIDGKNAPIYRANYSFRAIELAQGEHTITFSYFPHIFIIGCAVSVITLLGIFISFMIRKNT